MILAAELKKYTSLDSYELCYLLDLNGYPNMNLNSSKFLGVTDNGDFCYSIKYFDDHRDGEQSGKVYVKRDTTGAMSAEF